MNRNNMLPIALFIIAAGILGAGVWMWVGTASTGNTAATEHTDAGPAEGDTGTPADELAEKRVPIPGCPVALKLDRSFREQPIKGSRPALRLRSKRRMIQLEADCRSTSAENFDPDQFLHDIYRGMELKHKDAVAGRTPIDMNDGEVVGSSIELRAGLPGGPGGSRKDDDERVTYNNVMVRGRTIVMLKVGGPVGEVTGIFNDKLLQKGVVWSQ